MASAGCSQLYREEQFDLTLQLARTPLPLFQLIQSGLALADLA
jgi:hypothetical protein